MTPLSESPDRTAGDSHHSSCHCKDTSSLSPFSVYDLPELSGQRKLGSKSGLSNKYSTSSRRCIRELNSLIVALICISIQKSQAFVFPNHSFGKPPLILNARTASPATEQAVQAVAPMTSSSKEKRLSAQKAWERARALDLDGNMDGADTEETTPFLDLFTDAGIATVKNISPITKKQHHTRPRGRPNSVPGAMSRTTLMNNNEREIRLSSYSERPMSKTKQERKRSSPVSTPKKRRRGRPRKYPNSNTSIDEITKIAATNVTPGNGSKVDDGSEIESEMTNGSETETLEKATRLDSSRARKQRSQKSANETTGMMQTGKGPRGKDNEQPTLQRYYRTELLSSDEEYTIGMKIKFMVECELVHDGLFRELGRAPSIAEWSVACGFKDHDKVMCDPNYVETGLERQIRPANSEAWDVVKDPNMFVGNGLVNASGPGRGRGRVKQTPPTSLEAFYDDSDIKLLQVREKLSDKEVKKLKKELEPVNKGSPRDFIEVMLTAKEAKQRMVQCNMRLVVSISKRYRHVGVNIADLVQEGSIGLTRAAEKFDPKKGFKFSTYASWWIQQAVFRSIAYHSRTIRLPVHVHNLLNRVRRVRLELQRILGRPPTNEEMAAELDMTVSKYNKMLRLTRKAISLDMAKYQNNPKDIGQESETSLGDTINSSDVLNDEWAPERKVDQVLFRDDLQEMLKILGDDERTVISARYGLRDGLTRTVTTVAAQMGESKSWVRSQECRALRKLRRPWYEKRLWEHQNSLTG